jgi:hypothetical protein
VKMKKKACDCFSLLPRTTEVRNGFAYYSLYLRIVCSSWSLSKREFVRLCIVVVSHGNECR